MEVLRRRRKDSDCKVCAPDFEDFSSSSSITSAAKMASFAGAQGSIDDSTSVEEPSSELLTFDVAKTVASIQRVSADTTSFEFVVTAHLRMSGVYWGLTAMSTLGKDLMVDMRGAEVVEWVLSCYKPESGGFGGNVAHDAHILYTLSALQILALCNSLHRIDREKVISYVTSLQLPDGSVMGDEWGEVDTRFSYCALQALALLKALPAQQNSTNSASTSETTEPARADSDGNGGAQQVKIFSVGQAVQFLKSCRNFDGGFGAVPGAESHAGQIFCCVGALSIAGALDMVDRDLLGWWLAERQCDSGGLNGRPEKQSDVCYSWWILSSLSILGRVDWIDRAKLVQFILQCQDPDDGGISDRPGNMGDIFHTFFGVAGLSLLGFFSAKENTVGAENPYAGFRGVDPTYALPARLVEEMGLPRQVLE